MKRTIMVIIGIIIGLLALLFTYAAESHGQPVSDLKSLISDSYPTLIHIN